MTLLKKLLFLCSLFLALSCSKDKTDDPIEGRATIRKIVYVVNGTHFKLNYIDSNSVFRKDQVFDNFFRYEFRKGSGASIGISIFLLAQSDIIYSWEVYIDDKLYANALSEGGAYLTVPYQ